MLSSYAVYLFHVLFVGPMLLLIGLYHDSPKFPKMIWDLIAILGIGLIIYHSFLAYKLYKILNEK